MVSATKDYRSMRASVVSIAGLVIVAVFVCLLTVALAGCSRGEAGSDSGSTEASAAVIPHGGAAVEVRISEDALKNTPEPWVLDTPESAVRSYLDWTAYGYRIARSDVATPTMTPYEEVRVDSYVQYNIQKSRIIDQTLENITFGKPSVGTTSTLVPVKETWSYRYVSIETAGETIGGPYSAKYDSIYTVVKSADGVWQVDSAVTTALGEVK